MAHSIEVLLDPGADAAIRAAWQMLDEAGLPSQVQVHSPTNRPHVTLLAARRIRPEVDDLLRGLADRFPLRCPVGAPLVFGGRRLTLARLIVPSAPLLALHEEVYRRGLPYVEGEPYAHCRPGQWTPHATLGRRMTAEQVGLAMALVTGEVTREVTGETEGRIDGEVDGQVGGQADLPAQAVGLRRWDSDERVDHLLVG